MILDMLREHRTQWENTGHGKRTQNIMGEHQAQWKNAGHGERIQNMREHRTRWENTGHNERTQNMTREHRTQWENAGHYERTQHTSVNQSTCASKQPTYWQCTCWKCLANKSTTQNTSDADFQCLQFNLQWTFKHWNKFFIPTIRQTRQC